MGGWCCQLCVRNLKVILHINMCYMRLAQRKMLTFILSYFLLKHIIYVWNNKILFPKNYNSLKEFKSKFKSGKVSIIFSVCFQAWVANFERPRMNANSLLASPTGLSPYLRFGCLSCRLFYFKLTDLYKKVLTKTGCSFSKYLFKNCL